MMYTFDMEKLSSQDLGPDFTKPDYKPKDFSDFEEKLDTDTVTVETFPLEETGNAISAQEQQQTPEKKENLPEGLINTIDLVESLSTEDIELVYKWYSEAMGRRDREPLLEGNFINHFFGGGSWEPTYAFGKMEKGYILGFYKHDIFIPTHFAPKTMRDGYTLFKELADNKEMPVATAVTDDLSETLLKMDGWHKLNVSLLAYFNSDLKKKVVVYNSAKGIRTKIIGLLKEFWEETRQLKKEQETQPQRE